MRTGAFFIVFLLAFTAAAQDSDSFTIRQYPWSMNALYYPRTPGCDSVYADTYDEVWYYNSDSLFHKIATEGRTHEVEDLLQHYYYQVMDYMSMEKRREEYSKMCEAARRYRSDFLQNEADFMEIAIELYPLDILSENFDAKIEKMNKLVERAVKRGDRNTECVLLFEIFQMYKTYENYSKAFSFARTVLQKAEALTIEECPMLRIIYSFIGDAYYRFKDYDRAFFCMKKVESLNGILFADRHSLLIKERFAQYYASRNQIDSSDYYFRSMYDSREKVRFRAAYDVSAVSGIAANMVKRGEYDKAVPLLERWRPEALKRSYAHAADILITLAKCFIFKKQYAKASVLIDSAQVLIATARPNDMTLREKLYNLQCNYYEAIGNASLTALYGDSARLVARQQAEKNNALIILRAEQELFEIEKNLKDEQIAVQQSRIFFITLISLLSLLALGILIFFYRKKQVAYRQLVAKNIEWAGIKNNIVSEPVSGTYSTSEKSDHTREKEIVNSIYKLFEDESIYTDVNLSLPKLADYLNIPHRNYVSEAINTVCKCNFSTFINDYRIKFAIKALNNFDYDNYSFEQIAEMSGFASRQSFYNSFKIKTGLTPAVFRKNRQTVTNS
ncbi:MAG: helix-turn-helix domain-containing protein [Prevotellaceae bacterium]|jgi:AraC-like DNA-binding protein|nr:helix-turn-helix domain-containing protein [Prevotellaceae bacterium]